MKNLRRTLKLSTKTYRKKLIIQFFLALSLFAIEEFKILPSLAQNFPLGFANTESIKTLATTATYEDSDHPDVKINTTSNDVPDKSLTTNNNDLFSEDDLDDLLEVGLLGMISGLKALLELN